MATIKVSYKDKIYDFEEGTSLEEISKNFKNDFTCPIVVGSINNMASSLSTAVNKNCNVDFFDITSPIGKKTYERGLYFLLCKAVKDILNCDVKIMHCFGDHVYCDVLSNDPISEVTVEKIKLRMNDLVDAKVPISKIMVSRLDAIEYYQKTNQFDKSESLRYISNSTISLYRMDDSLDYFFGVLPNNTSLIDKYNIKLLGNNKIVLLMPDSNAPKDDLRFEKNDMLIKAMNRNDDYLKSLRVETSVELNKLISTGNYGDLIRLSEALQTNRLIEIASKISKDKDLKIVLITGPSSSGKTTTARKLSMFLKSNGLNPIPISVDNFYFELKDRVLDKDGKPENERISAIDTGLFNTSVSELLKGNEVKFPTYNFITGKREFNDKPLKMNDNSILIVEGIHAFNEKLTEMIPDKNKFKIFICPITPLNIDNHNLFKQTDNRLLRRIVRDNQTRGMSASKTLEAWSNVRKAEDEMIFPYIKDADEIFNTSLTYELGVLKTYAEPLLFSVSKDDKNYDEAIRMINLFREILGVPSENVPNDSILREFIGGSCFKE